MQREVIASKKAFEEEANACRKDDVTKPVNVTYALAELMIGRLIGNRHQRRAFESKSLEGDIGIMSDPGFLVPAIVARKKQNVTAGSITFIAHTEADADYARELSINVLFVPYDKLNLFFSNAGEYNYSGMKFDVMLGNPPFNPPKSGDGRKEGSKIWQKFIEWAFEHTTDDAHLLFVTPHNWRQGNFKSKSLHRRAQSLMFNNRIEWWMDTREPFDHFPMLGDTSVDAWHVVKGQKSKLPEVLRKLCLLPKSSDPETLSRVAKFYEVCMQEEPIEWFGCDSSGRAKGDLESRKEGDEQHPYRVANTSAQVKKGYYHWGSDKRETHGFQKVLVCASGQHIIGYDDGNTATGRQTGCYIVSSKQEGDRVVEFLQSPLVKFVADQFMKPGALGFPMELFERVPKRILTGSWKEIYGR